MRAVDDNDDAIRVGDRVQLAPRERPFHDDPAAWWKVTDVSDRGIDVLLYNNANTVVVATRFGVAPSSVRDNKRWHR